MKRTPGDTRTAIIAAAAAEFAAHGFDGASVDAIAARARFNKAMIYYHFENKQRLYVEILRDGFRTVGAHTAAIADDADLPPAAKIDRFIDALDDMAASRPYMPPMMMREMAEGAVRLDADSLRLLSRIFENLRRILEEGSRLGVFRPADPVLTYFTLVTPVIFFRASTPVREALARQHVLPAAQVDATRFVTHLKSIARTVLTASPSPAAPAKQKKRTRQSRPGEHA